MRTATLPGPIQELIDHPSHGGCGVGALADPTGPSREVLDWALAALVSMEHRGGSLDETGDGAGLLFGVDPRWFGRFVAHGKHVPEGEHLSVGSFFFPAGEGSAALQAEVEAILRREGLMPLGWRRIPLDEWALGRAARESRRDVWQLLCGEGLVPRKKLALAMWNAKQRVEAQVRDLHLASFSPRTVAYKALCTGPQLTALYPDLRDPTLATDVVILHRRYSTNTYSNWYLAQPFRLLAHNGEINSIKANRDATRNLEAEIHLSGVLMKQGSDSADLDRVVELFVAHGVPLLEALVRVMPPAHADVPGFDPAAARFLEGAKRALGSLGAWEGPAGIVATDGRTLVARLDRMGLRPMRWLVTRSGRLAVASEIGAFPVPFEEIAESGQLDPGEAIALDLARRRLVRPPEILDEVASHSPLNADLLSRALLSPVPSEGPVASGGAVPALRAAFGWTRGRVRALETMTRTGAEPISSMGHDKPLAVLSDGSPTLFRYFKQIVAVVTNPPIDPIREGTAIDLSVFLGRTPRAYLESNEYRAFPQIRLASPLVNEAELRGIVRGGAGLPEAAVLDATYPGAGGPKALSEQIADGCVEAIRLARSRSASILVLSDRRTAREPEERLPVPAVLLAGAVHAALAREGRRRRVSLVVESGEVQEPHDVAVLVANGADAVCPWLAFDLAFDAEGAGGVDRLRRTLEEGLKRVMSKMGITSVDAYRGSRLFEAVGISPSLVDHYLPGTASRVGGIELTDVDAEVRKRGEPDGLTEPSGAWSPELVQAVQAVSRGEEGAWARVREAAGRAPAVYLRDRLAFRAPGGRPIPLDRVATAQEIVAAALRGAAISHGSVQRTAHRAIAAALNELGAQSNCGEGGEDRRRNRGGPWAADRSRIRQIGSARFGVDAEYLVNADDLQIKIGQGAKPGEGGHLPKEKVTPEIAAIRRCPAGVALISPPPHHDIYSIEDLAQLIHNLRAVNPAARISVKCPSVTELGTIAVGVAKAGADLIDISGCEGGTGAAPSSSIEHAGLPLERGLSEAHQALVLNGIRGEVRLRADGGIKTGEDVVKLMALGADEVALATALMVAEQCTFCHGCTRGTCPAGLTTQDPVVSRRFMAGRLAKGQDLPADASDEERYLRAKQAVQRYLLALAGDVRGRLAALGMSHPRELVGRVDLLDEVPATGKAGRLDLSALLLDAREYADPPAGLGARCGGRRAPSGSLNARALEEVRRARSERVELRFAVANTDRAVGATLSGALAAGTLARPTEGIRLRLSGCAGQGLGFALVEGVEVELDGFANDGVGEAMSGGRVVIRQPAECRRSGNAVAGNAVGYGAVGGEIFLEGRAGQRLGVRNSGATLVAEGAGKYAFEYMTCGTAVLLGPAGPVLGSGQTGGVAFIHDPRGEARRSLHADAAATPLLPEDREVLESLVRRHAELTGSEVAKALLGRWEQALAEFFAMRPAGEASRSLVPETREAG